MVAEKRTVSAVLDRELVKFLQSIGELHRVTSGEVKCVICGTVIDVDNIALVFPSGKKVKYICQQQMCMVNYSLGVHAVE